MERSNLYKVVIIGDPSVGKTSIRIKLDNAEETLKTTPTVGVDFLSYQVTVGDKTVMLQIWDTAGQERFKAITQTYYKKSFGCLLVFDITKRNTFTKCGTWLQEFSQACQDTNPVVYLIGTKLDLQNQREVSTEEAQSYAASLNLKYFECSAQTNPLGIRQIFQSLAADIFDKIKSESGAVSQSASNNRILRLDERRDTENSSGCSC